MRNNYNKLTWKMKSTVKQIPRINNWDVCKEIKKSVQRNKQSICSGITLSCTRPCNTHAGVSQWLVKHGFTITLSNTEYNHRQVTLKFEVKFRRTHIEPQELMVSTQPFLSQENDQRSLLET
ncbi:hypothetical protein WN944_003076 [Citrus x changshan-huyou]|uniref:Uncharacterized protein n=1 Tax=Citrus x changshan-huyou TaxID=2935761 RepID=A0AAP0LYT6_9ROSI